MKRILITGGAGFIGSSLAIAFRQSYPEVDIICLDNLSRRGSELNLPRLKQNNIKFIHGDVRVKEDIFKIPEVDWLLECSAEPSVHAGYQGCPNYLIQTNLNGAINCLEYLREKGGHLLFLSSSRVYPIQNLRDIPLQTKGHRFEILDQALPLGLSIAGISENFDLKGARSLYGTTKLSAEYFIQEYAHMYGIKSIINRCGVIAGAWQMGKVDQGFMALWVAQHILGGELKYMGFEGKGLQVRDVLHVMDLFELIKQQMQKIEHIHSDVFNVGGGIDNSVSLFELTEKVREITSSHCEIGIEPATKSADIPYYVTDNSKVCDKYHWQLQYNINQIIEDISAWIGENKTLLKPLFMSV